MSGPETKFAVEIGIHDRRVHAALSTDCRSVPKALRYEVDGFLDVRLRRRPVVAFPERA